jgi:5-methylcytosine-specific restriction endonuclease McrA
LISLAIDRYTPAAMMSLVASKIPASLRARILLRDAAYACVYCVTGRGTVTCLDHVKPEYRGGKSTRQNLVKSCDTCNTIKGVVDLDLFARQLQRDTRGRLPWRATVARIQAHLALPLPPRP